MIEVLQCEKCSEAYTGDPTEARLCLYCDEDNAGERNVSVFQINALGEERIVAATLAEALELAKEAGLDDADWCIDEIEPLSYHGIDVHYRDEAHELAYRAASEAAKRAYWESRRSKNDAKA